MHKSQFRVGLTAVGSEAPTCVPDINSSQGNAGGFLLPALPGQGPANAPGEDASACSGDPGPPAQLPFLMWIFQETALGWAESPKTQNIIRSPWSTLHQPLYGGQGKGRLCLGLHSKLVAGQGHRGSSPAPGQGSSQSPTKPSLQPGYTPGQEPLFQLTGALSDI